MNRAELQQLLHERLARHESYVASGQTALASYVEEDKRQLRLLAEHPGYMPGACITCSVPLPPARVVKLSVECVPCASAREEVFHATAHTF